MGAVELVLLRRPVLLLPLDIISLSLHADVVTAPLDAVRAVAALLRLVLGKLCLISRQLLAGAHDLLLLSDDHLLLLEERQMHLLLLRLQIGPVDVSVLQHDALLVQGDFLSLGQLPHDRALVGLALADLLVIL